MCSKQKNNFHVQKFKTNEFSLPFSGGGPKMAHLEFRGKMSKLEKKHDFPKNISKVSLCE